MFKSFISLPMEGLINFGSSSFLLTSLQPLSLSFILPCNDLICSRSKILIAGLYLGQHRFIGPICGVYHLKRVTGCASVPSRALLRFYSHFYDNYYLIMTRVDWAKKQRKEVIYGLGRGKH